MAYNQITFAQAKDRLSRLLNDSGKVFWTDAELGRYIREALRTWNCAAQYYKERGTFNTTNGQAFYDLGPNLTGTGAVLLLDRTTSDVDIINDICDALMEQTPFPLGTWRGTDKFDMPSVLKAIEQARDQFLYATSSVVYNTTQVSVAPPANGRIVLADQNVADVRRVDWKSNTDNRYRQLWREDEWSLLSTRPSWDVTAEEPEAYSIALTHALSLQLAPVPINGGTLDLIVVKNGVDLLGLGSTLEIPTDFSWAIKYGALSILLNEDGQVRDAERTAYCQRRWQEAIAIANGWYGTVMYASLNGTPGQISTLMELDSCNPLWRNTTGTPDTIAMEGWNMIAISPVPNGSYSVTCDVIRNAPIPSLDADFLDLGKEYVDGVIGYAQHLASFKMGGQEFGATETLVKDFYDNAMAYNNELKANGTFIEILEGRARREAEYRPPFVAGAQNGNS